MELVVATMAKYKSSILIYTQERLYSTLIAHLEHYPTGPSLGSALMAKPRSSISAASHGIDRGFWTGSKTLLLNIVLHTRDKTLANSFFLRSLRRQSPRNPSSCPRGCQEDNEWSDLLLAIQWSSCSEIRAQHEQAPLATRRAVQDHSSCGLNDFRPICTAMAASRRSYG